MRLIYRPEGGEQREWTFIPGKMVSPEAEALERVTGWEYAGFGERLMSGSTVAKHALLWVFLRRQDPKVRYDDVQFAYDEVELDFDPAERAKIREALDEKDLSDEQREALETYLAAHEDDEVPEAPKHSAADAAGTPPAEVTT